MPLINMPSVYRIVDDTWVSPTDPNFWEAKIAEALSTVHAEISLHTPGDLQTRALLMADFRGSLEKFCEVYLSNRNKEKGLGR